MPTPLDPPVVRPPGHPPIRLRAGWVDNRHHGPARRQRTVRTVLASAGVPTVPLAGARVPPGTALSKVMPHLALRRAQLMLRRSGRCGTLLTMDGDGTVQHYPAGLLDQAPAIPVVVVEDAVDAVPMARALVEGGLPVIEITLRTPAGPDAIARITGEVPGAVVGAGTVRTPAEAGTAMAAGAQFLVSPGCTAGLLEALRDTGLPVLPGVGTVSEALTLFEAGLTEMKFFPAEAAGGIGWLRAVRGPLPEVRFCPTGGITDELAPAYLALPNVPAVGGTWMLPADAVAAGDWSRVTALARRTAGYGAPPEA